MGLQFRNSGEQVTFTVDFEPVDTPLPATWKTYELKGTLFRVAPNHFVLVGGESVPPRLIDDDGLKPIVTGPGSHER